MWATWLFAALYFPALQVLPLYIWHNKPRSETIYRRIVATSLTAAAAAWVPTARRLAEAAAASTEAQPPVPGTLLEALGLRTPGLLAACALPLALTALLFAGPLLAVVLSWRGSGRQGAAAWAQQLPSSRAALLRNLLVAPLAEEFTFRSCLVSFLLASGSSPRACVWLSPLLFGASHLHHMHDLVRFQGLPLRAAAQAVAFQLTYTTVFGWLAAYYFVRTQHLVAAVLPHAFCNFMGPPTMPRSGSPHRRAVIVAFVSGVVAFTWLLQALTDPPLFANS